MKSKLVVLAAVTLLAAPVAFAGDMPKASVGAFYSMIDYGGTDGDGFGVRGWVGLGRMGFLHGEYSMLGLDDGGGDVDQLRFGGGVHGKINPQAFWLAKGEYIVLGGDADANGLGAHGGIGFMPTDTFSLFGTVGYLIIDNDGVDVDGLEFNVGGKMNFSKDWSGQVDYRSFMGEDEFNFDFDVDEIRLGANYSFY